MPTFDTPEPITVTVELSVGDLRIVASERTDTTVDVRPSNSREEGRRRRRSANPRRVRRRPVADQGATRRVAALHAARRTRVDRRRDRVAGRFGAARRRCGRRASQPPVASVNATSRSAPAASTSPTRDRCSSRRAAGDITVGRVARRCRAHDQLRRVACRPDRRDRRVQELQRGHADRRGRRRPSGERGQRRHRRRPRAGDVLSPRPRTATCASAKWRVAPSRRETARGRVDIGVAEGVAAWLDLETSFGNVQNCLDAAAQPEAGEDTVEVRARTAFGDITVRRAPARDTPGK